MPHYQFLDGDYAGQAYKRYQQYAPSSTVYGGYSQPAPSKPCTCLEDVKGSQLAGEVLGRNSYVRQAASWFGWGDYNISTNSLIQGGGGMNSAARLTSAGAREVRLVYREYIGDVYTHPTTPGAFYQQNFALNPGLIDVAPWLSSLANNYEQWRPNGILFEFVSTSGEITDNQALGKIIMATDYRADTLETKFSNVQEMLAEAYSQEAKPTSNMVHGIECHPAERTRTLYYTRAGGNPTNTSLADYDLAQTTIATVGGPTANTNLGSLYIHWDVSLFKPTMFEGVQNKGDIIRMYESQENPDLNDWMSDKIKISNGTGFAGGSWTPPPDLIMPIGTGIPYDSDFQFTKPGGVQYLVFPRWAAVGSCWLITMIYTGQVTTTPALTKTPPYFGNPTGEYEIISQGVFPNELKIPASVTGFHALSTTRAIIRVVKNNPDDPMHIYPESQDPNFFVGFTGVSCLFSIQSVPNFVTG